MSVEATALSRSKLEQKDRSELAAIVEAMGGKAGSRAKKAELVDLVLELAGASPTPSSKTEAARTNGDPARADVTDAPSPSPSPSPARAAEAGPAPASVVQATPPDEEPP